MTLGIWFLSSSVWTIFYGYDSLSVDVFSFYILQSIINSFFYVLVDTTNALDKPKIALGTLFGSFILKAILNVPMMHFMKFIGIEAYYGTIVTTMLVQALAVIYLLYKLNKVYKVSYKSSIVPAIKILLMNGIMLLSIMIIRLFLGNFETTRLWALLEIIIYTLIGGIIYLILSIKNNMLEEVFGKRFINKILRR